MTNNQLTKEWLQQTIAELESVRDEIPFGIDTNSELELAAFRLALAAMDSEPVAYAWVSRSGKKHLTRCEPEQWRDAVIVTPLYRHAQPAPVVPDERPSLNNGIVGFDEGWNACRAAMLQAGNSPVIPDTWIPVSERLPEFGDYLVTDGCDFDVQLFNGEEFIPGFIWEDKITHWMPLPTVPPAPTQENI